MRSILCDQAVLHVCFGKVFGPCYQWFSYHSNCRGGERLKSEGLEYVAATGSSGVVVASPFRGRFTLRPSGREDLDKLSSRVEVH
jgi:hypothetical protein